MEKKRGRRKGSTGADSVEKPSVSFFDSETAGIEFEEESLTPEEGRKSVEQGDDGLMEYMEPTSKGIRKSKSMKKGVSLLTSPRKYKINRKNNKSLGRSVRRSRNKGTSPSRNIASPIVSPIVAGYKQILALDPRNLRARRRRAQEFKRRHRQRVGRKKRIASFDIEMQRNSVERTKQMRQMFFAKYREEEGRSIGNFEELLKERNAERKKPKNNSLNEEDDGKKAPFYEVLPAAENFSPQNEEEYNERIDEEMQKHLKKIRRYSVRSKESLKSELSEATQQLKAMKKSMLDLQDTYVEEVKRTTNNLLASLRAHLKLLEFTLKSKMQEYGQIERRLQKLPDNSVKQAIEKETPEQFKPSEVQEKGAGFLGWFGFGGASDSVELPKEALKRHSGYARECVDTQVSLSREIRRLAEQIELIEYEIYSVQTEHYFPKRMQWKLRLNAGEYCLGMRDLDFDSIKGDATLRMGEEPGVIHVNIRNIAALVGISNLTIRGSSIRSKLSKFLFTPTVNRMDIGLSGDWTLVLKFEPASEANNWHASWKEDQERSSLKNLKLNREMSGLSALRMPTKWIEHIATSLIPQAVNSSIRSLFSPSFGSTLLDTVHNRIVLEGQISFRQHIHSSVFRAPLIGRTQSAENARNHLNLSYAEAVYLDSLMRGKLGSIAGYKDKNVSIERLRLWRLQYAAHPIAKLQEMCNIIQKDTSLLSCMQAAAKAHKPSSMKSLPMDVLAEVNSNTSTSNKPENETNPNVRENTRNSLRLTMSTGSLFSSLKQSQPSSFNKRGTPKAIVEEQEDLPAARKGTKSFDSVDGSGFDEEVPESWLFEILNVVEDLSQKRVTCKLELTNLGVDLDLNNIVRFFADTALIHLEDKTSKAASAHAKKIAGLRKAQVESEIIHASNYFKTYIFPMLSKTYQSQVDAMILGGLNAGVLGLGFRNLTAGLKLENFSLSKWLGWSAGVLRGYDLDISGMKSESTETNDPAENTYTIKFNHRWKDKDDELYERDSEEDGRFTLGDVNLNLFPKGEASGTTRLTAESFQSWFALNAFSEFFAYWGLDPKKVLASAGMTFGNEIEPENEEVDDEELELVSLDPGLVASDRQVNLDRKKLATTKTMIDDFEEEERQAKFEKKHSRRVNMANEGGRMPIFSADTKARSMARDGNVDEIKKDQYKHPYLPRILLDPYYNLSVLVQNLEAKATKVKSPSRGNNSFGDGEETNETIALSLERVFKFSDAPFALFQMDWNLAEMFDDVRPSS